MTDTPTTSLTCLPRELYDGLLLFLDYYDVLSLRLVNRYCRLMITPSELRKCHRRAGDELHKEEIAKYEVPAFRLDRYAALLVCYHCVRWRPAPNFTSPMIRGVPNARQTFGTSTIHIERHNRHRICVDCGVKTGFYAKGARVGVSYALRRSVCCGCQKLFTHSYVFQAATNRVSDRFCLICAPTKEIARQKEHEWADERRWRKYRDGMKRGKEYRDEKGRRLRLERGIETPSVGPTRYWIKEEGATR